MEIKLGIERNKENQQKKKLQKELASVLWQQKLSIYPPPSPPPPPPSSLPQPRSVKYDCLGQAQSYLAARLWQGGGGGGGGLFCCQEMLDICTIQTLQTIFF